MTDGTNECEATIQSMNLVAAHIKQVALNLDTASVKDMVNGIIDTKRVFLMGAGRSSLAARAFAMRLMHMGFDVYVVAKQPRLQYDRMIWL